MYIPSYTATGELLGITKDSMSIPVDDRNRDYRKFLQWLSDNSKTLEQWLADNPYTPWGDKTVAQLREDRIQALDIAVRSYVYQHYEPHRQVTLTKLQMDATRADNQTAYDYIEQCWTWIKSCFAVYYTKAAEIQAAQTHEGVMGVAWDLSSLDASDPQVTLQQAMVLLQGD
jgi:hypothetical protein